MAEISIPGVSNKYKTNDYVEALMAKERIPLTREQDALDRYKEQQDAWRSVNQKLSALRDSSKSLYSFENPFNNKLSSSTEENAVTATADRDAAYGEFKVDVLNPATADRFLSGEIEKNNDVPRGTYTFQVNEKKITFNWRGGKLSEFVTALNRRGTGTIKASLIGVNGSTQSLLLESLKTGKENSLILKDAALTYALDNKIVEEIKAEGDTIGLNNTDYAKISEKSNPETELPEMPLITSDKVSFEDSKIEINGKTEPQKLVNLPPRNGIALMIPPFVKEKENQKITFNLTEKETEDITIDLNNYYDRPSLGGAGGINFDGTTVLNMKTETGLEEVPPPPPVFEPIDDEIEVVVLSENGIETKVETGPLTADENGVKKIGITLGNYENPVSILAKNRSTGKILTISDFYAFDEKDDLGYRPVNPASVAGDAKIKYEGITITRPTNDIDDIVPNVTLHLKDKTDRTATIKIEPDTESAKDALITFVGTYNQAIATMNVLSENKPEIISELEYLSSDEQETLQSQLGMFQGDFSLSNGKTAFQNIITNSYKWSDTADITMLSQIGISSRATGAGGGYSARQLRGYLEIDEKKLDEQLQNNLDQVQKLFGYDSDGDLIIDSGIGWALDKQASSWVSTGGILANKQSNLNTKVKTSESKIKRLEQQLAQKEMQLKDKYGRMEGTLNSLQGQSNSISNWANSGNNR